MSSRIPADSGSTVESRLRAGLDGWRGAVLILAGWPIYAGLAIWLLNLHFHAGWTREVALGLWALVSTVAIIATWATIRTAHIAVAPNYLQIGRSPRETIVDFSEIESLVEGLPAQESAMMKMGRWSHYSAPAMERVSRLRREIIFLRLSGGRFLALYISTIVFANAHSLRMALLERNRNKLVGADSYTPEEIKRLGNVNFQNRIGML